MRPQILVALPVFAALAAPAAAEWELSVYSGIQESPHSRIEGTYEEGGDDFSALIGWEGRSFEMPPYYGLRATWWRTEELGVGIEFNHTKVYAPEDERTAAGFDDLELTDGLNIITANVFRRFPQAWGTATPYVGGGVGIAVPHVDVEPTGGPDTFEYQLTGPAVMLAAGVSYPVADRWSVFGEYKFTYSMNEAELSGGGSLETDIVTNAINIGVSYSF